MWEKKRMLLSKDEKHYKCLKISTKRALTVLNIRAKTLELKLRNSSKILPQIGKQQ